MSGFSIMDLFRGKTPDQPTPAPQGGQQQTQTEQVPTPGQQAQPNPAGADGQPAQGLEKFKDLFTPLTPEQLAQQQDFNPDQMFASLNPEAVQKAVSQVNFANGVSADDMAAVAAGGNEAVAALARIMNTVGQNSMAQGLMGSAELVKQALKQANSGLDQRLGKAAKQQMVQEAIFRENPALRSPAAKPIVDALQHAISLKNPSATPQELQEAATEYLAQFAAVAAGKQPNAQADADKDEGLDWLKHFTGN